MRAFFYWGAFLALSNNGTEDIVRHIHGRSSGAIVGALILCGIQHNSLVRVYTRVAHLNKTMYIVEAFCVVLAEELPDDAHERCNGRLFVTSALFGVVPCTTCTFTSKSDLIDRVRSSGFVPYVTGRPRGWRDMLYLDGGFVDFWFRPSIPGIVRIVPPAASWPQWCPLSAQFPLDVVHASIQMGRAYISSMS
jgi:predicted acylesterase/phospholipase RssA